MGIFMTVDPAEQLRRIEAQGGNAEDFKSRWIPLEEKYLQYARPWLRADLCADTSSDALCRNG